jgi:predicted nucleic acid-binding protein
MSYLIDTNILSELRKGDRCDANVAEWFGSIDDDEVYLSVLVIGEIQRCADRVRRRDPKGADRLDRWVGNIATTYAERILPVTLPVARLWGSTRRIRNLPRGRRLRMQRSTISQCFPWVRRPT